MSEVGTVIVTVVKQEETRVVGCGLLGTINRSRFTLVACRLFLLIASGAVVQWCSAATVDVTKPYQVGG